MGLVHAVHSAHTTKRVIGPTRFGPAVQWSKVVRPWSGWSGPWSDQLTMPGAVSSVVHALHCILFGPMQFNQSIQRQR